jgi:DNA-directed RNA polymerase specialized sigma24 family protein
MRRGELVQALLNRRGTALLHYAEDIADDREQAQDAARAAFLALCDEPLPQDPNAVLVRFLRHCRTHIQRNRQTSGEHADVETPSPTREPPVSTAERLHALPCEQREALRLRLVFGVSDSQAADVLECSPKEVSERLTEALRTLAASGSDPGPQAQPAATGADTADNTTLAAYALCELTADENNTLRARTESDSALTQRLEHMRTVAEAAKNALLSDIPADLPAKLHREVTARCRDADVRQLLMIRQLLAEESNMLIMSARCTRRFIMLAWPAIAVLCCLAPLSQAFGRMYDEMLPGEPLPALTLLVLNLGRLLGWGWFLVPFVFLPVLWLWGLILSRGRNETDSFATRWWRLTSSMAGLASIGNVVVIIGAGPILLLALSLPLVDACPWLGGGMGRPDFPFVLGMAILTGLFLICAGFVLVATEAVKVERADARRRARAREQQLLADNR